MVEVKSRSLPNDNVTVRWDVGTHGNYRTGQQNAFDLRVIDNAPIGVRHSVPCSYCLKRQAKNAGGIISDNGSTEDGDSCPETIFGIRWHCTHCAQYDLCTMCYMDDRHDVNHKFLRFDRSNNFQLPEQGILMPPRKGCKKLSLKGLYPGAKVKRSADWSWDDQDGGPGKTGKLNRIQNWDNNSGRSVASVTWSTTGLSNVYRAGHKGKVDIECTTPATFGPFYLSHLPILGKEQSLLVDLDSLPALPQIAATAAEHPFGKVRQSPPLLTRAVATSRAPQTFEVGDQVKVAMTAEELKVLQEDHGGFNPKMASIIGLTGAVHRLTTGGDVRVQYPGNPESNFRWTVNPFALTKVKTFQVGDLVVLDVETMEAFEALQKDHGGCVAKMKEAVGKTGLVVKVYGDGDVRVEIIGNIWTFNPACLSHASLAPETPNWKNPHDGNTLKHALNHRKHKATDGKEPMSERRFLSASSKGDLTFIRTALEDVGTAVVSDNVARAAMLAASQNGHLEVLKCLAEAYPNEVGGSHQGKNSLHVACHGGHSEVVEYLLGVCLRLLEARDDEGDSALHYAAYGRKLEVIRKLLSMGADPNAYNEKKCSLLHIAVVMEDPAIVELLLR